MRLKKKKKKKAIATMPLKKRDHVFGHVALSHCRFRDNGKATKMRNSEKNEPEVATK